MQKKESTDDKERRLAQTLWLNYFNRYLFEHGTISEKEFAYMSEAIAAREAKADRKRA